MSYLRRIRVSEIMNEHVVTGRPDDSLSKIASQMERHKIGSVVIVRNGRVVGILTEEISLGLRNRELFRAETVPNIT